jgi:hypothetical protein
MRARQGSSISQPTVFWQLTSGASAGLVKPFGPKQPIIPLSEAFPHACLTAWAGIVGGLGFCAAASLLSAFALLDKINSPTIYDYSILIFWATGLVIALTARATAKAWHRLFITSAVVCLIYLFIALTMS